MGAVNTFTATANKKLPAKKATPSHKSSHACFLVNSIYFTGRAIALRPKPRDTEANRPRRVSCDLVYSAEDDCWYLAQKGQRQLLPAEFSGWAACSPHDGVAHATTAHRTFRRMERTRTGGFRFPPEQTAAGGRCSVYIVDHTGTMQFAEVRLPAPPPPALPLSEADQSTAPSVS